MFVVGRASGGEDEFVARGLKPRLIGRGNGVAEAAPLQSKLRAIARLRVSFTNAASFGESFCSESRLISTFARAPSRAAFANAIAVIRSDFIFGFVMGWRVVAIFATSTTFSATPKGTLVACLRASLMAVLPSLDSLADL